MKKYTFKPLMLMITTSILTFGFSPLNATSVRTPQLASEVDRQEPLSPEEIQAHFDSSMQKCSTLEPEERQVCEDEVKDKMSIEKDNAYIDQKDAEKREKEPIETRKTAY